MRRILTLLLLLVLVATNGTAVAAVLCQHQDAQAHQAALASDDAAVSADAEDEENAAKSAGKKASASDASASLLGGYMLPPDSPAFALRDSDEAQRAIADYSGPPGLEVPPLLRPPLA